MKKKTVQIIACLLMVIMMVSSIDFASYASEVNAEDQALTEIETEAEGVEDEVLDDADILSENTALLDEDQITLEGIIEYGEEIELTEEKIYSASSMGLVLEDEYYCAGSSSLFYLITNHSGRTLDISTKTIVYNKSGNAAGEIEDEIKSVPSGMTVILGEYLGKYEFMFTIEGPLQFQTTFKAVDSKYNPVMQNLYLDYYNSDGKEWVTLYNPGSYHAYEPAMTLLFYKAGKIVYGREDNDRDNGLPPESMRGFGTSLEPYIGHDIDFDEVKVYISGGHGEYNPNIPDSEKVEVEPNRIIAPDLSKGQLYRFSRPDGGDWLITCNEGEILNLLRAGWSNDGQVGNISSWGNGVPVYRFSNSITNDRMFSDNDIEIENYNAAKTYGWVNEGIAFYYNPKASIEVTRYATFEGLHIWSTDPAEQKNFDKAGWKREGQAFRVDWVN